MKRNTVKGFLALILVFILMFTTVYTSYAETLQDNIEAWIEGAVNDYNSAETEEEKASIQDRLSAFLEENGLEDIDLSGITDSDIGNIVSGFTDGSAFGDLFGLASDAWSSGMAMIQDVFNKGAGTADGSNTATTKPSVTSPNIIVADTTKAEASTQAVGIVVPPSTTKAPAEITTYDVGATTAPAPVGSGVTTTVPVTNPVVSDSGASASSVAVFAVLALATLAVIVAIVVFFVLKYK